MKLIAPLLFVILFSTSSFATESVAVLFDVSRSVPPQEFQEAKEKIQQFTDHLESADEIRLYTFGNELKKIAEAELGDIQAIEGNTLFFDAVYDVARDMASSRADRKAIILVTDGLDTKSATVFEDIASYAESKHIVVYPVGVGKSNRKMLERIAKLTGGKYYSVKTADLAVDLADQIEGQKAFAEEPPLPETSEPAQVPVPQERKTIMNPPAIPQQEAGKGSSFWFILLAAVIITVPVIAFVLYRAMKQGPETELMGHPSFTGPGMKSGDSTQEILKSTEAEQEDTDPIPPELLQKRPVTEESLTKTFVLMETPMLVVRKGKNLGQSFSLNRAFPISIGRSRVNEINWKTLLFRASIVELFLKTEDMFYMISEARMGLL